MLPALSWQAICSAPAEHLYAAAETAGRLRACLRRDAGDECDGAPRSLAALADLSAALDTIAACDPASDDSVAAAKALDARDDAADAYDILVRRVWEAATGDTHEGPASVDVLLEAVAGLRARADGAEAARDALRAAARHYCAVEDATAFTHEADAQCAEAKARLRTLAGEG